jgi:hypothetical protein
MGGTAEQERLVGLLQFDGSNVGRKCPKLGGDRRHGYDLGRRRSIPLLVLLSICLSLVVRLVSTSPEFQTSKVSLLSLLSFILSFSLVASLQLPTASCRHLAHLVPMTIP